MFFENKIAIVSQDFAFANSLKKFLFQITFTMVNLYFFFQQGIYVTKRLLFHAYYMMTF